MSYVNEVKEEEERFQEQEQERRQEEEEELPNCVRVPLPLLTNYQLKELLV